MRRIPQYLLLLLLNFSLIAFAGPKSAEPQPNAEPEVERFEKPLSKLAALFREYRNDPTNLLPVLRKEGRGPSFAVEGLFRLYEKQDPKWFKEFRETDKGLEDQLGWWIDSNDHLDFVQDLKWDTADGKPPQGVLKELEKEKQEATEKFVAYLRKQYWIEPLDKDQPVPSPKHPEELRADRLLRKMKKRVESDWNGPKADRKYVIDRLVNHLDKEILGRNYDLVDLENGLHKFRREVRWFTIMTSATNGLAVLDNRSLPEFDAILKEPIAKSHFAELPPADSSARHIFIPRSLFVELTQAVQDYGTIKDIREAEEIWLKNALAKSGYATPEEAQKKARALVEDTAEYQDLLNRYPEAKNAKDPLLAIASQIFHRVREKVVPPLRKALVEQRSWSKGQCGAAMRMVSGKSLSPK